MALALKQRCAVFTKNNFTSRTWNFGRINSGDCVFFDQSLATRPDLIPDLSVWPNTFLGVARTAQCNSNTVMLWLSVQFVYKKMIGWEIQCAVDIYDTIIK